MLTIVITNCMFHQVQLLQVLLLQVSTSEDGCDTLGGPIDAYPLTEFTNAAISNGKVSGVPLVFETVVAQ